MMSGRCSVSEVKTWRTKPRALTPHQHGTDRLLQLIPAPAVPSKVPAPLGDLRSASASAIVAAADTGWDDWATESGDRAVALRLLLGHLEGFTGRTWQERWLASGLDEPGRPVRVLQPPRASGRTIHRAFEALLCMRVIRPSVGAMRSNRLPTFAETFRRVHRDAGLDEFFERAARADVPVVYRRRAVFDVCCALTTQGIDFDDLTAEAFLHYARECRLLVDVPNTASTRFAEHLAWDVLYEMERLPPQTPRTLRAALRGRPLTVTELVDRYPVDDGVRQLFIDYLHRRQATLGYGSLLRLSRMLVCTFWMAITQINPAQVDLRVSDETYQQWRAGLRTNPDGSERLDIDSQLVAVRALYYDIQAWAAEEPEHWARWVAPCPIRAHDMRGAMNRGRRATDRVAERTRRRQPLLSDLVEHVEAHLQRVTEMLASAGTLGPDETVMFDGRTYRRLHTTHDARNLRLGQRQSVRVRHDDTGEEINLTRQEESAFWDWAFVEVLRHTGVRVEEMVELSQLSIRRCERPNGEVVALLVVAPSKTDRERVIPMSAELFHVIAAIIRRHTTDEPTVPLVTRFDHHQKVTSAPQPFLFQRRVGSRRETFSTSAVGAALRAVCARLGKTRPEFAHATFSPHDFRRLFATDLVNNGLPIHIGAMLLGHLDLQTTRGYVTVFNEDVVRHYQTHLERRRRDRPQREYRPATPEEWAEFEEHFDRRKVELGNCARPYGTPCSHEHPCIRCPMLHIAPDIDDRLAEIETDLDARRDRAIKEGWQGEIEGIDLTLNSLTSKRDYVRRRQRTMVTLGPTRPAGAASG
jgi:site-specific recombinase XerC